MGNVLQALALALAGGAQGVSTGMREIGDRRDRDIQIALRQAQMKQQQEEFEESKRRADAAAQLSQQQRDDAVVRDFATNSRGMGISFLNPKRAYTEMNTLPTSENIGIESPIASALDAANRFVQKNNSAQAFYKNAETAGSTATRNNNPRGFIAGSEPYGGAYADAEQFSPYSSISASMRNAGMEDRDFSRAVGQARARIEQAYRSAYSSFAKNQGYSDITQLVQDHPELQGQAEAAARAEQRRAADAEFSVLQTIYPDRLGALSPDALTGSASAPSSQPAQSPATGGPRVTQPQGARQLPLNFDPNDPLGIGKTAPPKTTNQQTPQTRSTADPLGLFTKP